MANVSATITFETGITKEVPAAELGFVAVPNMDQVGVKTLVAIYNKTFKNENCSTPIAGQAQFSVVDKMFNSLGATDNSTPFFGAQTEAVKVGEVNVTTKMKDVHAVIGGEGNGGVIYPESHYGRDALVGIALFLSSLAHKGCKVSELRASFPNYFIAKNRIDLTASTDVDAILVKVKEMYGKEKDVTVTDIDGVKLDFPDKWVLQRRFQRLGRSSD